MSYQRIEMRIKIEEKTGKKKNREKLEIQYEEKKFSLKRFLNFFGYSSNK